MTASDEVRMTLADVTAGAAEREQTPALPDDLDRLRARRDQDPHDKVVFVQRHRHSEPICAWPDCETYLTREQMAKMPEVGA